MYINIYVYIYIYIYLRILTSIFTHTYANTRAHSCRKVAGYLGNDPRYSDSLASAALVAIVQSRHIG